jgi:hypothetical protein
MPDVPKKRVTSKTRHEWVIGREDQDTDAKNFRFGLHDTYKEMEALGVNLENDDAFHVTAGDGGEVILYVALDEEGGGAPESESNSEFAVRKLRQLHYEGDNEARPGDAWPEGHCNYDGEEWPCRTIRILDGGH